MRPDPGGDRTGPGSALEVVLGAALVAAAAVALHRLGSGPLAAPPLTSLDGLRRWVAERDAVTVGLALARLAVLVVLYHLVVTTAVALVGRALGRPGWVRLADAATLPPLRGSARRLAGLGLSVAAAVAPAGAPVGAHQPPGAATVDLDTEHDGSVGGTAHLRRVTSGHGPADSVVTLEVVDTGGTGEADLVLVPDHTAADHPTPDAAPGGGADPTGTDGSGLTVAPAPAGQTEEEQVGSDRAAPPVGPGAVHVVVPGDHLWAIAERTLHDHGDGAPSADDVAAYWRAVLAANPQLVDPDLVYPGDPIDLPPLA